MDPTAPPRSKSRSRDRGGSNSRSSGGGKRGMSSKPPTPSTTKTISSSQARKAKLAEEIATLTARVMAEAPPRSRPIPSTKRASSSSSSSAKISSTAAAAATSTSACLSFAALPLSQATHRGLLEASYTTLTAIQQACIPHALAGRDILGAARTGRYACVCVCGTRNEPVCCHA